MAVITVLGEKKEDCLGIVAMHEHLLLDAWSNWTVEKMPKITEATKKELFLQKVAMSNLSELKLNAIAVLDNIILSDIGLAIEEVLDFKKYGGDTLVDLTNEKMGRDPVALKKISRITGLNIITCTGIFVEDIHPEYVESYSIEDIAGIMVKEIMEGIGDTGIRAGIIGEIGVSRGILKNEIKVLKASAIAQKETGVGLSIHIWPFGFDGIKVLDILEKAGVDLRKVIICHVDGHQNLDYQKELLNRGSFIEFDHFGKEFREVTKNEIFIIPNDLERIQMIYELISCDDSYIDRILISTDRSLKTELLKYGGFGYGHILKTIQSYMKKTGFIGKHIDKMLKENPKNILTFEKSNL